MSCQTTQKLMDGFLDGELDLVRNVEIQGHLQECPACQEIYQSQQALRSAVRAGAPYFKAPAELQKRVRQAVRKASKAEPAPRVMAWHWLGVAVAAAAVVVLAVILVPVLRGPSGEQLLAQEIVSSHVRSLMAAHLTDVPSSDQHTVKPWFSGKLDFSPDVKDLAKEGFTLVGGRLDYLTNRPVAALVYQRRQHVINLFIWPAAPGENAEQKTLTRQGYTMIHWNKSGMTYWAVSDLNKSELEEFVKLMQ